MANHYDQSSSPIIMTNHDDHNPHLHHLHQLHHHLKLIVKVLNVELLISTNTTSPVVEKRGILISRTAVDCRSTSCCSSVLLEGAAATGLLCLDSFSPPSPIDVLTVCGLDKVINRVSYDFYREQ